MNDLIRLSITVDGKEYSVVCASDARLLDILREDIRKTCVREGCGEGECGACSIFMNGRLVNSCSVPAVAADGADIVTIEGFSGRREYKIITEAYSECGAVQCGFCTPGFILATAALLEENIDPSDTEIRNALSGNLCRCTGYSLIIDAVKEAAERIRNDE